MAANVYGMPNPLFPRFVHDHRVHPLGERPFALVGVLLAEVNPLEAVELVHEQVEAVDVEVTRLVRVLGEEVSQHLGFEQFQHLGDEDDVALRGGERLAVEREPLVGHRNRRFEVHHVPGDVLAARPRPFRVVLAERFEVHAERLPLGGPLEAPREFPVPQGRRAFVSTAVDDVVARLQVGADVLDGARVHVELRHRLRHLAALLADGVERDVLLVHLVLILREHLARLLGFSRRSAGHVLELAGRVHLGVRHHVDGDAQEVRTPLDELREVFAVGLTAVERVRDVGVRFPEVASERSRVHVAQFDDVAVQVGEFSGKLSERVPVVGGEDLSNLVAPVAKHLGDEVASHDFVDVAEMGDARRRDAALDDDGVVGVSRLDSVGHLVGPEDVMRLLVSVLAFVGRCRPVAHSCTQ